MRGRIAVVLAVIGAALGVVGALLFRSPPASHHRQKGQPGSAHSRSLARLAPTEPLRIELVTGLLDPTDGREQILTELAPQRLAVAHGAEVSLLSLSDASEPLRLPTHPETIQGIRLSPDGTRLVTLLASGAIRLFDADSGSLVQTLSAEGDWRQRAARPLCRFSPDSRLLVCARRLLA